MKLDLVCSGCGATPEERRDRVSPDAKGYLCCRCLMRGATTGQDVPSDARQGVDSGEREPVGSGLALPGTSGTVLRYIAPVRSGRANKPGRPSVTDAEKRQRTRDRVRAFRAAHQTASVLRRAS